MRFVLFQTGTTCDTHHFHVIATRLHVRCQESTKRLRRIVGLHLEKWNVKSTSCSREKHTLHFRFYWLTHSDNRKQRSFIIKMNTSMTILFLTMRGIPLTKSLKKLFSFLEKNGKRRKLFILWCETVLFSWWFQLSSTSQCTLSVSALTSRIASNKMYAKSW